MFRISYWPFASVCVDSASESGLLTSTVTQAPARGASVEASRTVPRTEPACAAAVHRIPAARVAQTGARPKNRLMVSSLKDELRDAERFPPAWCTPVRPAEPRAGAVRHTTLAAGGRRGS